MCVIRLSSIKWSWSAMKDMLTEGWGGGGGFEQRCEFIIREPRLLAASGPHVIVSWPGLASLTLVGRPCRRL
ncbi:uncharacterized protein MYCFIDRAFT_212348 [Pseudocercospora fijiensis CIRAD86]|uniref:Uncharacterized protein n=1 Tax=Pseudocercospora fijiensis (strain CIRAD86) TaxID=383855 RepID=M2ZGP2_PSEFD|nr:uncharacterized protein MYCFIDRAFT_212348 [Pseudocercospora fijiensis CIRAD86]EME78279.1 hypothetical protein MYCFIDRAFT_212348 [Pseudocercospora fijiensis CIRAD86]